MLGFSVDGYLEQALQHLEQHPERLASQEEYERRLMICGKCSEKMADGCCRMCGCYVILRARVADEICPYRNRWKQ